MSNVDEILVRHYIFDLSCDMDNRIFHGSVILYLEPASSPNNQSCSCDASRLVPDVTGSTDQINFIVILDCNKINILQVGEVEIPPETFVNTAMYSASKPAMTTTKLGFEVNEWCIKIWKNEASCQFCFPKIIKIDYATLPEGSSLLWVKDQDQNPSVFTYGSWINNRSLYPCQEPPTAMATWEATISVAEPYIVLMSGDSEAIITEHEGIPHYYYSTKNLLPMSTLALAVGQWELCKVSREPIHTPCRIAAVKSQLMEAKEEYACYVGQCFKAVQKLLGPYPFPRIDFLIVPPGFGSLGMASPNIVFLSQSVLNKDASMGPRIAHEIAHGWFGLLIGALDWTEEWLSEGFATFMEDYIHVKAVNLPAADAKDFFEFRSYLRLRNLQSEVENTEEELQILRVNQGEAVTAIVDSVKAVIVKNGTNPQKGFIQVHYIKGYFLIKYLSTLVGVDVFMQFLREYTEEYKGQLVESQTFLKLFASKFQDKGINLNVDEIIEKWLHNPGIPNEVVSLAAISETNNMFKRCRNLADNLIAANSRFLKKNRSKKRKLELVDISSMHKNDITLILEFLLDEERISSEIMTHLQKMSDSCYFNAEGRHRFCELIVKHGYKRGYSEIQRFMQIDLAMGVYIYGEMIFSGIPKFKNLAIECFNLMKTEMEPNYVVTIENMLEADS